MERHTPAEPFHPGEYIKDGMDARGWNQDDLAEVLGRGRQHVNRLLLGKTGITPETAHELAKAFDTTAELWMNLQTSYELALAAKDKRDIERRAKIYNKLPIRDLKAREWISDTKSVDVLESEVCRLLRVSSIDQEPCLKAAARMSTSYGESANPAQIAWICRARELADLVHAVPFDQKVFCQGLLDLRKLAAHPQDARRVPKFLADIGVRLVLIQHLPKSKIDGVALWTDAGPAVALSLRYDRLDNFWFTLMHELSHILHCDETLIDVALDEPPDELPESERRANNEAAAALIPPDKLESFFQRTRPLFYQERIVQFAQARGVHPSIVAGQLRHRDQRLYKKFTKLNANIREFILGQAITDGWGNCPVLVN